MRMIGQISSEADARTFGDYLHVQGIENQIEPERNGPCAVWIHNEDEVEKARGLLQLFARNPQATSFREAVQHAGSRKRDAAPGEKPVTRNAFDADDLTGDRLIWGMGRFTAGLVITSVVIWLMMVFAKDRSIFRVLFIDNYDIGGDVWNRLKHGLISIRQGQIWRLITPIFIHDLQNFLHILFNMLWMRDLGTMVEMRRGWKCLLGLVLVTGAIPNLAQYFASGPRFGGMSGVVYGLLGYVWMKSKFDPGSGFFLHPTTVVMMLIWLAFGFTNLLPIANTVHTVGLVCGMAWGLASLWRPAK